MKEYTQSSLAPGNCWQTAIACILEVDPSELPDQVEIDREGKHYQNARYCPNSPGRLLTRFPERPPALPFGREHPHCPEALATRVVRRKRPSAQSSHSMSTGSTYLNGPESQSRRGAN